MGGQEKNMRLVCGAPVACARTSHPEGTIASHSGIDLTRPPAPERGPPVGGQLQTGWSRGVGSVPGSVPTPAVRCPTDRVPWGQR